MAISIGKARENRSTRDLGLPARRLCPPCGHAVGSGQARGISGLKIFKQLGLEYRNPDGSLIKIDDARWYPIWAACGRLGIPVIMHTADPSAFFEPITPENERYEELSRHPDWHFPADKFPPRAQLHAARNRVIADHPGTTFIAAHMANDGEDLEQLGAWLDQYPNMVVELASRISELGRQPLHRPRFPDQVSGSGNVRNGRSLARVALQSLLALPGNTRSVLSLLRKRLPPQGLWQIYGVYLPDEVLKKIYHGNAARIIPASKNDCRSFSVMDGKK